MFSKVDFCTGTPAAPARRPKEGASSHKGSVAPAGAQGLRLGTDTPPPQVWIPGLKSPGDAGGDRALGTAAPDESLQPPGDMAAQMKEQGGAASACSPQPLPLQASAQRPHTCGVSAAGRPRSSYWGDEPRKLTSQYTASSKQFSSAGCPQIGNFKMHPKGSWRSQEVRTYFLSVHQRVPASGEVPPVLRPQGRDRVPGGSQLAPAANSWVPHPPSPTSAPPSLAQPLPLTHDDTAPQGHGQGHEDACSLETSLSACGPVRTFSVKGMGQPGVETGGRSGPHREDKEPNAFTPPPM